MTDQTASFTLPGYTDLQWLARGGFSSVYRSTQIQYNRPVAVKVLDVGLDDERSRRQYQRECDATGRLTGHPNIVTVLDSGFTSTGKPFLVMDLCVNGTMGDRLAVEGPLPIADVLRTGVKIAGALETAHQGGILHRDLKPANILITAYGEPALSDFGIAAVTSHLEASVTMSAMTPNHAPPEVLEGSRPTPASDIYSLASTLYTLLAGRPPFAQDDGHSILAFITRVLTADVPPIPRHDIPPALTQTLVTALAKDPDDRQASAALFGYELQQVQVSLGMPYSEMVTRTFAAGTIPARPTGEISTIAPAVEAGIAGGLAAGAALAPNGAPADATGAAPATADATGTVAPPAAPAAGTGAAPVGDATILRPGAEAAAATGDAEATGAGAPPADRGPTIAPPTPQLGDRGPGEGELTVHVDRHAPVIERVEVEVPTEERSRTPVIVGIVVLVLVVLAGAGYLVLGRGGDDTASSSSTTSPSTTAAPASTDTSTTGVTTSSPASTTGGGPSTTSSEDPSTTGAPVEGTAPEGVEARTRDADGQIVIDASWRNPSDAKLPVLYQLLAADGTTLTKISTLGGGTASVIITDADDGPLSGDQTYCVAVGFINQSAQAVWAPAACTDGSTLEVAR